MTPSFQMLILLVSGSARPSIRPFMGHHEIAPGFAGLASPLIRAAGEASDVDSASQVRSARGNQGCTGVVIPLLRRQAPSLRRARSEPADWRRVIGPQRRIVGGQVANAENWRFAVAFVSTQSSNSPFCGGTLIGSRFVLTASHCFLVRTPPLDGRPRRVAALRKFAGHRWDTRGEA